MSAAAVTEGLELVRHDAGAAVVERDVVRVVGPEATTYLQGQASQDLEALPVGQAAPTFVLQPQGKVDAWMRATRIADDAYWLDTDAGWGQVAVDRLLRFRLRTAVEIDLVTWPMVAVRGPRAVEPQASDGQVAVAVPWVDGVPGGWDLLGPDVVAPAGVTTVDPLVIEILRIEAGIPRMGAEVDQTTIPAETGLVDVSVSFTKGCYTGQELVARVDSRGGRAPRRVVRIDVEAGVAPPPGAALLDDGSEVGRITSAAADGAGRAVALGVLARAVETPTELTVEGVGRVWVREVPGLLA